MKFIKLLKSVNMSKENSEKLFPAEIAQRLFDMHDITSYDEQTYLHAYWLSSWLCTDTLVGTRVYVFNHRVVAWSRQPFRKSDEEIQWRSRADYNKVREWILTYKEDIDYAQPKFFDENDMWPETETYKVQYYEQLLPKHKQCALHNGLGVEIVDYKPSYNDADGKYHHELVNITNVHGTSLWVQMKDLEFKFNITE